MSPSIRHQLVLVFVAVMVLFTNLGTPRLWDRDEPRNAGCTYEMLQANDWVVPVFNAELRTHKPILLYWFMMTAYGMFGVGEFAARFWSASLALGTVLMTYHIGRRLFNAQAAFWGAIALTTALMFDVAARAATPDSILIFFSTASLFVFVFGAFKPHSDRSATRSPLEPMTTKGYFPRRLPMVAGMYGLMGMAVLAKGPVGLVLPTAVIGMFLLIMRLPEYASTQNRWRSTLLGLLRPFAPLHFLRTCLFMRPLTAILVASLVALPWYIWVGIRTDGAWLRGFFFEHNLNRAMSAMEGHHGPVFYYPVVAMIGFFPWSLFFTPMLIGLVARIRRRDPWSTGYIFLACWVGVYVGLFSLAQTKLPSYITPMYPALALITGAYIYHWKNSTAIAAHWWPQIGMGILALVGLGILIAIPSVTKEILPGEHWLGLIGLIPLVCAIGCFVMIRRGRLTAATMTFAAMSVLFTTTMFGLGAVRVDRHQQIGVLLGPILNNRQNAEIAAYRSLEPSWVFYARKPIRLLRGEHPEKDAADFLAGQSDRFLITTTEHYQHLQKHLLPNIRILAQQRYFLKDQDLIVLGREERREKTANSQKPSLSR